MKTITGLTLLALVVIGSPLQAQEAPRPFAHEVQAIAAHYGLDADLIHAVIDAESSYNPKARSPKNAQGLMQLIPATARRFGVSNPYDPLQNLHGGARYLRWLLDFFQGNVALALAGYNAGEGAVMKYGGVPPYAETQAYVGKVLRRWRNPTPPLSRAPPRQPALWVRAAARRAHPTPAPVFNPYTADTTVFTRLRKGVHESTY